MVSDVGVALDKSRVHDAAGCIDRARGFNLREDVGSRTHGDDIPPHDGDRSICEDTALLVHCDEVSVDDNEVDSATRCSIVVVLCWVHAILQKLRRRPSGLTFEHLEHTVSRVVDVLSHCLSGLNRIVSLERLQNVPMHDPILFLLGS